MLEHKNYKEAGELLFTALAGGAPGFVARVAITPAQADFADKLATQRAVLAKLAMQRTTRDYDAAIETAERDPARLASDRRAMLAELLVADVLHCARRAFSSTALVSVLPDASADLRVAGKLFDVKAAGQCSLRWSRGPLTNRYYDDSAVTINSWYHASYCEEPDFAGYVCVYVYVEDDVPYAADFFYIERSGVGSLRPGRLPGAKQDYYHCSLSFPDDLHDARLFERVEQIVYKSSPVQYSAEHDK